MPTSNAAPAHAKHARARPGPKGPARSLTLEQLQRLLGRIERRSIHWRRDLAMTLLAFRAGLRAAEIAALDWRHVSDVEGALASSLIVPAGIKRGKGRVIPLHDELRRAIANLYAHAKPASLDEPLIQRARPARSGSPRLSANAVSQHMLMLLRQAGFAGCSAHSGRRSFLTALARKANQHGCSLLDVQRLAGHSFLTSTAKYLEPSPNTADLVQSLLRPASLECR